MKNIMKNRMMTMVAGMLMVCLLPLAAFAQQQEWKSTSSMIQNGGSTYSSPVTPVGTTAVPAMATTTESYSPSKAPASGGPHRSIEYNQEFDDNDEGSPIGDPVLPMVLCAIAFAGFVYFRRKRSALNG